MLIITALKSFFARTRSAVTATKNDTPLRTAEEKYFQRAGEFEGFLQGQTQLNDYIRKLGAVILQYRKQNKVCLAFTNSDVHWFKDYKELANTLIKEWGLEIDSAVKQKSGRDRQ